MSKIEVCNTCRGEFWIHHQHPNKPLGVIMCSTPCPKCNPDGYVVNKLTQVNWWYTTVTVGGDKK